MLEDQTNREIYQGTYQVMETSSHMTAYSITVGEKVGTAVVSTTDYQDGSSKATLVMGFEDYTLYYFADIT